MSFFGKFCGFIVNLLGGKLPKINLLPFFVSGKTIQGCCSSFILILFAVSSVMVAANVLQLGDVAD